MIKYNLSTSVVFLKKFKMLSVRRGCVLACSYAGLRCAIEEGYR